jgi:hypothetical protein
MCCGAASWRPHGDQHGAPRLTPIRGPAASAARRVTAGKPATIARVELDTSGWSGDGAFTQVLIDALGVLEAVQRVRVEDAPASRADAGFSFISNEIFVTFARHGFLRGRRPKMTLAGLEFALAARTEIGAPDYGDAGMLQYLRTDRIVPPYQTRGYKLVEMVRIYATPE